MRLCDRCPGCTAERGDTLIACVATWCVALVFPVVIACAPRPVVVTEPTRVVAERGAIEQPGRIVQWYTDFWKAIANVNIPVAWTLAESQDQRSFAEALLAIEQGNFADADSSLAPLLHSQDTVVRDAARVTYGAMLSSQSEWRRLATFAGSAARENSQRDAAGVETWAPAFADVKTTTEFKDSIAILPLTRTATGAPVVAVRVNGKVKQFWLDTGSSISILSSSVAAECDVTALRSDTLQLLTAVGRIPARAAVVHTLRFGPLEITEMPSMIVDTANFKLRGGGVRGNTVVPSTIDGVIGFDVIRRVDITIDDARRRVIVRRPVVRAKDQAQRHNLFWFGVPIVTLVSERGTTLHFSLDTGAEETYGTRLLVAKAGTRVRNAERRVVNGFGGTTSEKGLVVPNMRLFLGGVPLLFERVFLYNARYPTIFDLDGTLGGDVGRGGRVRIDMTNGLFEVTP